MGVDEILNKHASMFLIAIVIIGLNDEKDIHYRR